MNLDSVVEVRIHPAIGIARVGNAPGKDDYFIGPQLPHRAKAPRDGYRDSHGRLKRQAAEFRIYGYDKSGKPILEITDEIAEIDWSVHVANKKAAWYNFDVALDLPEAAAVRSARRNAQIQGSTRDRLVIDPGPRGVSKTQQRAAFDTGKFFGTPVDLGEIRYTAEGRLLFLGGFGKSASISPEYPIATFANNPGWHDDTSDGPVSARVKIRGREIPVDGAWVVTAPPNYAPALVASQTMYDVIIDALGYLIAIPSVPSFTGDILPVLRQFVDAQWVNAGFAAEFGWRGAIDLMRDEFIQLLAAGPSKLPKGGTSDPFREIRRQIFIGFRDPGSTAFDPLRWPQLYGDAFFNFDTPPGPRVALSVTPTVYGYLQSWMQGNFTADFDASAKEVESIEEVRLADQPDTLDRAALHFCIGGPFHPGCEMTWPMRHASLYRTKFRLRRRIPGSAEPDYGDFMTADTIKADGGPLSASGPGDITKWLAVPWQTDTASCRAGYQSEFPPDDLIPAFWPSRVPDTVLSDATYRQLGNLRGRDPGRMETFQKRDQWVRFLDPKAPFLTQITKMIDHFHELGVIERRENDLGKDLPPVMYVETLPPERRDPAAQHPHSVRAPLGKDFQLARFRRLSRQK